MGASTDATHWFLPTTQVGAGRYPRMKRGEAKPVVRPARATHRRMSRGMSGNAMAAAHESGSKPPSAVPPAAGERWFALRRAPVARAICMTMLATAVLSVTPAAAQVVRPSTNGFARQARPSSEADAVSSLDRPVHARWTGLPLADWTERVSQLAGRPVVLDRRIDPDRLVTLECDGDPLESVLARVARDAGGAVEVLASSLRIVPSAALGRAAAAERARTREVATAAADLRRKVLAREPWHWPAGATPRALIGDAAQAAGIEIADLDRVPHDHVRAASLTALTLGERLDLVLAHYDLRVAWGTRPRIVAVEAADAIAVATDSRPRGSTSPRQPRGPGVDVFTLRLEAPLDEALAAIATRLGLVLDLDRDSLAARGMQPGEIVRARVTDASREELLDAVVGPLGLRWTIADKRLRVFAP